MKVYNYDVQGYYLGELLLDDRFKNPMYGVVDGEIEYFIPAQATVTEPPVARKMFNRKFNPESNEWIYEEISKLADKEGYKQVFDESNNEWVYIKLPLTLAQKKEIKAEEINNKVAQEITNGFICLVVSAQVEDGSTIVNKNVKFDSSETDQQNFADQQVLVLSNLAEETLPVRGMIEGDSVKKAMVVTQQVYLDIIKALGEHKIAKVGIGWSLKSQVEAAKADDELAAIVWPAAGDT